MNDPRIAGVSKVVVHYINMQPSVEVFLKVDPSLSVEASMEIANRARQLIKQQVRDVECVELHIDVNEPVQAPVVGWGTPQFA